MTIINTFGVTSGLAVARQIDEDTDKFKKDQKRRADAAHLAQKAQLSARLKQLDEEAALRSSSQRAEMNKQLADKDDRIRSNDLSPSFNELVVAEESNSVSTSAVARNGNEQDTSITDSETAQREVIQQAIQAGKFRQTSLKPLADANGIPSLEDQARSVLVTESDSLALADQVRATRAYNQPNLLDNLRHQISRSPGILDQDRTRSLLEDLFKDLQSRDPGQISAEERDGVVGYMEYLTGYFEGADQSALPTQQMNTLMTHIRAQLGIISDPSRVNIAQQKLAVLQSERLPSVHGLGREHRHARNRSTEDVQEGDGGDGSNTEVPVLAGNPISNGMSATASGQSSLDKDHQRRREETLVTVTMRSV